MEYFFSGTIDRIIFENASNFFKIILLEIADTDSDFDDFEIIVTGTIADVIEGENYTFWGELTQHPKYGEQLKVTRYERTKPTSSGLIKYFSSDHFKGIGKKTAEKIVQLYGDDTIDKILAPLIKAGKEIQIVIFQIFFKTISLFIYYSLFCHTQPSVVNKFYYYYNRILPR